MSDNVRFSGRQVQALGFLLEGCSILETARRTHVNEKTVRRWLNTPEFSHQLKEGERQLLEGVGRRLLGSAERAVSVLIELLETPDTPGAGVKRLSAVNLLELVSSWRNLNDFEERLSALEKVSNEKRN